MHAPRVGCVVVSFNTPEEVKNCLESLAGQVDNVVVVENGTGTKTKDAVLALEPIRARLYCPGENLGFGKGMNVGAKMLEADTEFFLLTNADVVFDEGAVRALVRALDQESTWAAVGPQVRTPAGDMYPSARSFPQLSIGVMHALMSPVMPNNRFSRRYRRSKEADGERYPTDWISGACFLIRRKAFFDVTGFDERYFMFAEDMDLCWRLQSKGWRVGIDQRGHVTHIEGASRKAVPFSMLYFHHRSILRFLSSTQKGWKRLLLPFEAGALFGRFVVLAIVKAPTFLKERRAN
jgi:N-acetylglucosaminyl-diphospho-decaprenol L-rhamnosyltransferase